MSLIQPMVVTITTAPLLLVLSVHKLCKMLPMISVLKAGDYQRRVNLLVLPATPPLSPLYIAGATSMARSATLAPSVTGGLLLRSVATLSVCCATAVVA